MRLPLPARGPKRWLAVFGWGCVLLTAFALTVSYVTRHGLLLKGLNSAGVSVITNGDNSYSLQVPVAKVPTTPEAVVDAPPVQILPAHWNATGTNAGVNSPGAADQVALVPSERAALAAAATGFLRRWETFPELPKAKDYARWRRSLARYLLPGYEQTITSRSEAFSAPGICPNTLCVVGSSWYAGYPANNPVTIRRFDAGLAYLTVYGFVRYHDPRGTLDGKLQLREYALLLQQYQGSWRVERAVADSLR